MAMFCSQSKLDDQNSICVIMISAQQIPEARVTAIGMNGKSSFLGVIGTHLVMCNILLFCGALL